MADKKLKNRDLEQSLVELQQLLEEQNLELGQLKEKLAEKQNKIADYQKIAGQLDTYKEKFRKQNREIRRERDMFKRLSEELHKKNEKIRKETKDLAEVMQSAEDHKNKLKEQNRLLTRQKKEMDRSNKLLAKMNVELSEKNRALSRMADELDRMAHTDALTEIFNRRTFMNQLELEFHKAVRYNHIICCIIFDLDDFKKINDTYGHLQGDEVLRQIAKIAKQVSRTSDVLARYGGEEFVLVLPETPCEEGVTLAERLRTSVAEFKFSRLDKPSEHFSITISLGLADSREKGVSNHEKLLNCADWALYYAKNHGKNQSKIYRCDEIDGINTEITPFPSLKEDPV
jgi:two-component system cell cycle response regulator